KDIRVILIKLADKLHNMRTLDYLSPERRKGIAQECLDIYAPLAGRLGISWLKDELEDLSLKHLHRDIYLQIKEIVALKKSERTDFLDHVQQSLRLEAEQSGINIDVSSRAKHFYSIYQKMRKRNKSAQDIYDLFGIRILCDGIENCYTLLGIVHRLWKPIDGRFKDYIAMPKSNGYQSLHTTVMAFSDTGDSGGRLLEIQIRTFDMHQTAEYGVAGHWLYKRGRSNEIVRTEDIPIVNRLKEWNLHTGEAGDSGAFLEDIKREFLKDSIFVFTPQGKVIELPAGAVPIDFAYSIHSEIGDHCMGAKADGVIIPLTSELSNTQVVEILTSPSAHPHLNWLRAVKTSKARSKIRSWLQQNDDSLILEKNVVARKKVQAPIPEPPVPERQEGPIQQRVLNEQVLDAQVLHVRVEDEKNMMIRFARCCHPVTGDPIIGYVSRGRGIIIHRKNCGNLSHIPDFEERKIDTEWENATSLLVKRFRISAKKTSDLFSEIEGAVRKHQGHLIEGRLEESASNNLTGFFTMQLEQQEDLKKVLKGIRSIPSVFSIQTLQ
ncbi:TGS domain-containing protein, partial [Treponema sp. OttesenSCG-928-L16]|nr:TGS domain-containing protein [Treponema sp. OttesenSCG-928-L16]